MENNSILSVPLRQNQRVLRNSIISVSEKPVTILIYWALTAWLYWMLALTTSDVRAELFPVWIILLANTYMLQSPAASPATLPAVFVLS